ncbi:hypothetical protein LTR93_011784 [Exophiala xenobiotica]|nr:hypothetical protein LTR93_011784 [Exophiala xenobiotica]
MSKQAEFHRGFDSSWKACVTRPSYRKRFEVCCLYRAVTQSTGLLVISAYGSVLHGTLGYGARKRIVFQCGYITVAVVFNIIGDLIVDYVGRELLMLIGMSSCVIWMNVEAAMVATFAFPVPANPDRAGLAIAVAALYLYIAFYAPTIDTAGFVYDAEAFPNHLRPKGVLPAICCAALIDVLYLQVASNAFAKIGWKFYLVSSDILRARSRNSSRRGSPLFWREDQVMVFSEDIVINYDVHELVIKKHAEGTTNQEEVQAIKVGPTIASNTLHIEEP